MKGKVLRMVDCLQRQFGGRWIYDLSNRSWNDGGAREVRRCVVMGGWSGDEPCGTQTWLYEDGKTPILVNEMLVLPSGFLGEKP